MGKIYFGENFNVYKGKTAITYGNRKMSIPIFSLPAIQTCPGSTPLCRKYCYAMKAQRLFSETRNKRTRNYELSMTDHFAAIIIDELKQSLIPYCRIHESGDFYSQEYLEKWYEICNATPEKQFLAFTKNFSLNFDKKPENLSVYYSVWSDTNKEDLEKADPRLKKAYTTWTRQSHIDKHGRVYTGSSKKCKGYCDTCLMCFNNTHSVYFPLH